MTLKVLRVPSKRPLVCLILATSVALPLITSTTIAEDANHLYFPMHDEDVWIYKSVDEPISPPGGLSASAVTSVPEVLVASLEREVHGLEIYRIENYFFATGNSTLDARLCNDNDSRTQLMHERSMAVYYPWVDLDTQFELPPLAGPCVFGTTGEFRSSGTVSVPAGTFTNTVTVDYWDQPCGCAGLVSEVFAPTIGLIQRTVLSFLGENTWSLTLAHVDGVLYASEGPPTLDSRAKGVMNDGHAVLEPTTWGRIKAAFEP